MTVVVLSGVHTLLLVERSEDEHTNHQPSEHTEAEDDSLVTHYLAAPLNCLRPQRLELLRMSE